jgi:hypothetical protein
MSTWVWIILLAALIKIPMAGLMLWIPYHYDESMIPPPEAEGDSSEEDGGSKALPAGPLNPHPRAPLPRKPRNPRRGGPHGFPTAPTPPRVRTSARSKLPLRVSH